MKRITIGALLPILLGLLLGLYSVHQVGAQEDEDDPALANEVEVAVTIDPDTGCVSVFGLTARQLTQLGFLPCLDAQSVQFLQELESASVDVTRDLVTLVLNDEPTLIVDWGGTRREPAYNLLNAYLPIVDWRLLEAWVDETRINLRLVVADELSELPRFNLRRPIRIDINEDELMVEEVVIPQEQLQVDLSNVVAGAERGDISQIKGCFNDGVITANVNDEDLPSITITPAGITQLLRLSGPQARADEAVIQSWLANTAGFSLAFPGGEHDVDFRCGSLVEEE